MEDTNAKMVGKKGAIISSLDSYWGKHSCDNGSSRRKDPLRHCHEVPTASSYEDLLIKRPVAEASFVSHATFGPLVPTTLYLPHTHIKNFVQAFSIFI